MVEQGTRVDRLVSIDVAERFEALQDEVDLLKNEIKQTLVDLREHMMKGRTVFSQQDAEPPRRLPPSIPPRVVYTKEAPTPEAIAQVKGNPGIRHFAMGSPQSDGMDPVMLGNIICWLGTVKQKGLSLQQVTPFLEAYETSGYLPPIMLKVLLRSLADLDQMSAAPDQDDFSPEHYADCIGQLHDIICAANIMEESPLPAPELLEGYPEAYPGAYPPETDASDASDASGPESYIEADHPDEDAPKSQINGAVANGEVESSAAKYNWTTIQVPVSQENFDFPETGRLNG